MHHAANLKRTGLTLGLVMLLVLVLVPVQVRAQEGPAVEVRPPWQSQFPVLNRVDLLVGETPLVVELSDEPWERGRGLSYRWGLRPGTGMLFESDNDAPRSYWMKGMRFCLDIIWIDDGEIKGAAENACPDPEMIEDADRERFSSGESVQYVLEMPAGWMAEHGYGPGTPVEGIPE